MDATTLQRCTRFARYWELLANSGRFQHSLPLLLRGQADSGCAFAAFMAFSDWLWARTCQTSGFTPEALVDHLAVYLIESVDMAGEPVRAALLSDYLASGARASPQALRGLLPRRGALPVKPSRTLTTRQVRHHAPRAAT